MRAGTYGFFHHDPMAVTDAFAVFVLGLRFDLRVVATLGLGLLMAGSVPWLNPFRDRTRGRCWLGVLAAAHGALVLLYLADLLHYRYLNQRLNASVLG